MTERYRVAGMACSNCVDTVTEALTSLDRIGGVDVDLATGTVELETTAPIEPEVVQRALDNIGYTAIPSEPVLSPDEDHTPTTTGDADQSRVDE